MMERFAAWFRGADTPAQSQAAGAQASLLKPIKVKMEREDRPKFRRIYTTNISRGVLVEITWRNGYGERYSSGCLTQPGGRWVVFDPTAPADKILDPEILPIVEAVCRAAREMDQNFIAAKPAEYIDEGGVKWFRSIRP